MKRFCFMIVCLSLLFSRPFVKVCAEESSTDTSSSVPTPTPSPGKYNWNDESKLRKSGIFTYQILDERKKIATILSVDSAVTHLTIPAILDGYNIISVGEPEWEWDGDDYYVHEIKLPPRVSYLMKNTLETLTISEGIQHIGYAAFNECEKLTTVNLPPNLISISGAAFAHCTSLKKLYIQKSNYKDKYGGSICIGKNAFASCTIDRVIWETKEFGSFKESYIKNLVLPRTDCRAFVLNMDKTTIKQVSIDPYVQSVSLFCEDNSSGTIEKVIVNGKKTELLKRDPGLSLGTLYTVSKAKCITWAKKYKQTYKVKTCGKMGKVTHKKQKATWKPVKTSVKTFRYNNQNKKWKTTSRKVKTFYKIYGKNSKKGNYKLIKTTAKTSYKTKYKYLKVQPVAVWE